MTGRLRSLWDEKFVLEVCRGFGEMVGFVDCERWL